MISGPDDAGVLVGLEIHQQLDTGRKLFCNCSGTAAAGSTEKFVRRLRPVRGELGGYDPAAVFEGARDMTIMYHADAANSCAVERDEEPPHPVDPKSLKVALVVAAALKSAIYGEIYAMRKTVIDGSNTGGFQRTMLVSRGGTLEYGKMRVGVQSICLEEDSARILGEGGGVKEYGLDRLGIPLVEIALEPVAGTPRQIRMIAETLGRLLRRVGSVARGIGTIRQDVNVSVRGGGGIVEIKGLQQLDQMERVIEYEARRQAGLVRIAGLVRGRAAPEPAVDDSRDVTDIMRECQSKIVRGAVRAGHTIRCIRLPGLAGVLGHEPYEGVRLGREIGELVKYYGIGGVFHSDELPGYGITAEYVKELRQYVGCGNEDAFVMVAAPPPKADAVVRAILGRISQAARGVPAETRLAVPPGRTVFLRPRPGSARMYPETDIPPVLVSDDDLARAKEGVPEPWEKVLSDTAAKYGINEQLAAQLLDSEYMGVFSDVIERTGASPAFAASSVCSTITSLAREGLEPSRLDDALILKTFEELQKGMISKESVEMIFRDVMAGNSRTVQEAIKNTGASFLDDNKIRETLADIMEQNQEMVSRQKGRAVRPLMGIAMSRLRGRAPGQKINQILNEMVEQTLRGTKAGDDSG